MSDPAAYITAIDLPPPTAPTHIKYRSTVFALNFFKKYNIHISGLANSRKKMYIVCNLFGASGCFRLSKKGPKLLLRAFCFPYIDPSSPKGVHNQSLQLRINPFSGRIRTKYKVKGIYTKKKESKSMRWVFSYRHRWVLSNSPILGSVLTGGDRQELKGVKE